MKSGHAHRRQSGFNLIEVMVAIALIAIMALGLTGLWVHVDQLFLNLQWRQKAVFLANSEMERLSALGRYTRFFEDKKDFADGDPADAYVDGTRWIYRGDPRPSGSKFVVTAAADFSGSGAEKEFLVFYLPGSLPAETVDDLNIVWLDKKNDVTALLEWRIRKTSADPCYDEVVTVPCLTVELIIEYPFRYLNAGNPAGAMNGDTGVTVRSEIAQLNGARTVELRTIMGRRQ